MKIKKFTAPSMPEAMKNVRNELGTDAVILNSRIVFSGGIMGFFRRKNIEVIAAVDPMLKQEYKTDIKENQKLTVSTPKIQPLEKSLLDNQKNEPMAAVVDSIQSKDILKEINQLKELIKSQSYQSAPMQAFYPEPVKEVLNWMTEQGFSPSLKEKCTQLFMDKWGAAGLKISNEEIQQIVKDEMNSLLSDRPYGGISFTKKYVNVIGPTGVGKTTTLAKIAAECVLKHRKKVAFITTDTYRIAAIDQLKTYAQILNIPMEVCYSLEDFQTAANKFSSYDVVLIDTAGRNFRNKQYVEELFKVINFDMDMETYLVLALTAKQKDMEDTIHQFSTITINQLIFTKADETSIYGSMFNLVEKYKIGISYVTTGQNVPDDLIIATPETITNLLIGAK